MSEIKPRSMRMSDENYTRLQSLSEGRSLDETISFLLSTHDKDEERSGLGNQAVKLDELDEFLNAIRSQFSTLLRTCQNAKEVVRAEYRRELEEKNRSLEDMKDEIVRLQRETIRREASSQEVIEQLRSQLEAKKEENAALAARVRELEKDAAQKQQMMDSLTATLTSAEKKAAGMEQTEKLLRESEETVQELRSRNTELTKERTLLQEKTDQLEKNYRLLQEENRKKLENKKTDCEKQLADCREIYEKQLISCKEEYEKQLEGFSKQNEQELQTLRAQSDLTIRETQIQAQAQINAIKEEYQNKLFELLMKEK